MADAKQLTMAEEMPDHPQIYRTQADRYERLVSREDYQGNILAALDRIAPLAGAEVVELGAGTGRLTRLLAPVAGCIQAFDLSLPMLRVAKSKLARDSGRWQIAAADHRRLPVRTGTAQVVVSGWSICYLAGEKPELARALGEIQRILRPDGVIIILETLGTGYETPSPPEKLKAYYDYLERAGFSSTWIRTDYRFESVAEAEALVEFFFGPELAGQVMERQQVIVPECTGIWWRWS